MVNRVESSPLVLAGGDYKVAILLHFHQSIYVFCWMHDIFFFLCHYVIFFFDFTKISFVYRNFVPIVQANFFQQERVFFPLFGEFRSI